MKVLYIRIPLISLSLFFEVFAAKLAGNNLILRLLHFEILHALSQHPLFIIDLIFRYFKILKIDFEQSI